MLGLFHLISASFLTLKLLSLCPVFPDKGRKGIYLHRRCHLCLCIWRHLVISHWLLDVAKTSFIYTFLLMWRCGLFGDIGTPNGDDSTKPSQFPSMVPFAPTVTVPPSCLLSPRNMQCSTNYLYLCHSGSSVWDWEFLYKSLKLSVASGGRQKHWALYQGCLAPLLFG